MASAGRVGTGQLLHLLSAWLCPDSVLCLAAAKHASSFGKNLRLLGLVVVLLFGLDRKSVV
jgi:hypothetical protein